MRLLHEEHALHKLEAFVDENDRTAPAEHEFPLAPSQWHDAEDGLQNGRVEQSKVKRHAETDCVNEDHVLPQRQREQRFGR